MHPYVISTNSCHACGKARGEPANARAGEEKRAEDVALCVSSTLPYSCKLPWSRGLTEAGSEGSDHWHRRARARLRALSFRDISLRGRHSTFARSGTICVVGVAVSEGLRPVVRASLLPAAFSEATGQSSLPCRHPGHPTARVWLKLRCALLPKY